VLKRGFARLIRMDGPIQNTINAEVNAEFNPIYLEVINESHMHNVPANSETHFKGVVVNDRFEALPLIKVCLLLYRSCQITHMYINLPLI
jgi:stress-induced morphogen